MLHANCMLMRGAGYTVPGAFRQTARPICPSISSDIVNEPKAGLAGRLQLAKLQATECKACTAHMLCMACMQKSPA